MKLMNPCNMCKFILFTGVILLYVVTKSFGHTEVDEIDVIPEVPNCYFNLTKSATRLPFPKTNLTDHVCYWEIDPTNKTGDYKISLFLETLFLHEYDELTIYRTMDDAMNDTNSLIDPIKSQNGSFAVITKEDALVVRLKGNDTTFIRKFHATYTNSKCMFSVPPDVEILKSPIYIKNMSTVECTYFFNADKHHRTIPTFIFETFNFTKSTLSLKGTTLDGNYDRNNPSDFFFGAGKNTMDITISLDPSSNDRFVLKMHMVDSACSGHLKIEDTLPHVLKSPAYVFNNGSVLSECRWIVEGNPILGMDLDKVIFDNVFDIVSVNDGGSELSPPIVQLTSSTHNDTLRQPIRSSSKYLWIGFKPVTYASELVFNVTVHGQGGYFREKGSIHVDSTTGNDTVFLLEVPDSQVIQLTFNKADFPPPAQLTLYDGFGPESPLLATLQGNVWYPVVSHGSQLKLLATSFAKGSFEADFKGIVPDDCTHMSTPFSEDYQLAGHCNKTCSWTIPPQDLPGKELLLNLQYVSLDKNDLIEILLLDSLKTKLGEVTPGMNHVPQLAIPANVGAVVKITRGDCSDKGKAIMVGHSSYVPGCNYLQSLAPSSSFHVNSPLYPDTYPVGANCKWTLESQPKTHLHLSFDKLQLAPNHCVRVTYATNQTQVFSGSDMPEDLLLPEKADVEFLASDCKTKAVGKELATAEGFLLNGTVADCGGILHAPAGQFNTSLDDTRSLCIWKISVPLTSDSTSDDINIITYSVSKKDSSKNYELHVFDGASVREKEIVNSSSSEIWGRTNSLIVVYKRSNVSLPPAVLVFNFKSISCNSSMQCGNKICMHPDWRCNGINDCGDFTDEKDCGSAPYDPVVQHDGYSSSAYFGTVFTMLILGIVLGSVGLILLQRYRNGQYRRFDDLSVIG